MSILHHIVWALINSIWQSAALAVCVFAGLRLAGRSTAAQRYAVWAAVLVACATLPALDFAVSESWAFASGIRAPIVIPVPVKPISPANVDTQKPRSPAVHFRLMQVVPQRAGAAYGASTIAASVTGPRADVLVSTPSRWVIQSQSHDGERPSARAATERFAGQSIAWIGLLLAGRYDVELLVAWFAIANLLVARLALGYAGLIAVKARLRYRELSDPEAQTFARMTHRPVAVGYSSSIGEPCVIGFRSPVIALPMHLSSALSGDDVSRVLRHECAHIGRWDDWGNLVRHVLGALLLFNPVCAYISRVLDVEREIACDDAVALVEADRILFAKCLYEIASASAQRRWMPATGLGGGRRQLAIRIRQLLDAKHRGSTRLTALAKLAALAVALSALPIAFVQFAATGAQPAALAPQRDSQVAPTAVSPSVQAVPAAKVLAPAVNGVTTAPKIAPVARPRVAQPVTPCVAPSAMKNLHRVHQTACDVRHLHLSNHAAHAIVLHMAPIIVNEQVQEQMAAGLAHSAAGLARMQAQTWRVEALAQNAADAARMRTQVWRFERIAPSTHAMTIEMSAFRVVRSSAENEAQRADFLRALREAGFTGLSADELVAIRNCGVSADFIRQLHARGLTPMPTGDLTKLANHGVDAAYLSGLASTGYGKISTDDIIRLRDNGVTPGYIAAMVKAGYRSLTVDELVRLNDNGVTPEYLAALARVGYSKIPIEDIIKLSDNGVDAAFIARVQHSGVTKPATLSIDDLIKLFDAGI